MAIDALGDIDGSSLPFRAETVSQGETLARLINTWPLEPLAAPVNIREVQQQDIPSVSSNCRNLMLSVDHEPHCAGPACHIRR